MTMKSKVSICIPTYNGEKYIKETLNSVINQTYTNYEVIIVDDCSKDNTINIIENEYKEYGFKIIKNEYKEYGFKIIKNKENKGMINNWNRCFEYAKGDYILFLFQDDILEKNCIEEKVNMLDNSDAVFVYSATSVINEKGEKKLTRKYNNKNVILNGNKMLKKSFLFGKNIFGEPSNIMYRRSVCDVENKFCTKLIYTPDIEYSLRMCKHGKIGYINKDLTSFRISKKSMTSAVQKEYTRFVKDDELFIKEFNENITKVNAFEKTIHRIMVRIRYHVRNIYIKLFLSDKA